MTKISTLEDFIRALRYGPYAWPGGYPLYWITADGEPYEYRTVAETLLGDILNNMMKPEEDRDGYLTPVALDANWEDPALYCAHSGNRIESAYAEDEAG